MILWTPTFVVIATARRLDEPRVNFMPPQPDSRPHRLEMVSNFPYCHFSAIRKFITQSWCFLVKKMVVVILRHGNCRVKRWEFCPVFGRVKNPFFHKIQRLVFWAARWSLCRVRSPRTRLVKKVLFLWKELLWSALLAAASHMRMCVPFVIRPPRISNTSWLVARSPGRTGMRFYHVHGRSVVAGDGLRGLVEQLVLALPQRSSPRVLLHHHAHHLVTTKPL